MIATRLPVDRPKDEEVLKVFVFGSANVGKSSLVNSLTDSNRCPSAPVPGTTLSLLSVSLSKASKQLVKDLHSNIIFGFILFFLGEGGVDFL
jgi:ribosome biogenesis GTPase A